MAEFRIEMDKFRECITSLKENIDEISVPEFSPSANFAALLELCDALEACSAAIDAPPTEYRNFAIPDELLTPEFPSNDPMLMFYEVINHLKKVRDFLIEFHDKLQKWSHEAPQKPKKIIKSRKPRKSQVIRLPKELLIADSKRTAPEEVPKVTSLHSKQPAIIVNRPTIDKNLLGTDYVAFNATVPDGRDDDLNQPSTSHLPTIEASSLGISKVNQMIEDDEGERLERSKNITEQNVYVGSEIETVRDNIVPQGFVSSINIESIPAQFESSPLSIQQQSVFELAKPKPIDIDENGLEIMRELTQQDLKQLKPMPSEHSTSFEGPQILICSQIRLKKTKFRKIKDQTIHLPQDICDYQVHLVDFPEFTFIPSIKALIDDIIKIRSTIELSSIQPAPRKTQEKQIPHHKVDEIQTQLEDIHLTRTHSIVQPLRSYQSNLESYTDIPIMRLESDQQMEIPSAIVDCISEQPSVVVQSEPKSPLPEISTLVEPLQKPPEASYANFESVLQKKPPNKKATPKRDFTSGLTSRSLKSLRHMCEADLVENINYDQYITLCTLREIRQKTSLSNRITIKSIQAHFGADRIAYCKLIRIAIDLQCHDIIRILKTGTEMSEIEIFED